MAETEKGAAGSGGAGGDVGGGSGGGSGGGAGPAKPRVSPWPDRVALILIWLAGIAITLVYQRPKGAGLYAEFWFGAMITVALVVGYMMAKRALGLPPVTLKLKRPKRRGGASG